MGTETLTRRPLISLITSRTRLPAARDGEVATLLRQVAAAAAAGVDLIQIREPDLSDRVLFELATRAVDIARGSKSVILVSDRFDVALAAGAGGTHLPAGSVPAAVARPHLPPGFLLGRSVHDPVEAAAAATDGTLDYVTMGTVFPSVSKPSGRVCGVSALAATTRAVALPVLAIGGITTDKTRELFDVGVAGVAAIGAFADPGPFGRFDRIGPVVAEIRRAYAGGHVQRA